MRRAASSDDQPIATVDADGVALAAIQGPNQKLKKQRAENAQLEQRLTQLEQLVQRLTATVQRAVLHFWRLHITARRLKPLVRMPTSKMPGTSHPRLTDVIR